MDYQAHLLLFHKKMNIPFETNNNEVIKIHDSPAGKAPFYQMFSLTFPSKSVLEQALATLEMQEVAADANRTSTGGLPVILIGNDVLA